MKEYVSPFVALVIAGVLGAIGTFLYLNWNGSQDSSHSCLQEQQRLSRELDTRLADVAQRNAAKEAIAEEVIAGRMGLFEAAAHYRALDAQQPNFNIEAFRLFVSGNSDEERYCRSVLVRVRVLYPPISDEDLGAPLEMELEAHLRRYSTVQLPLPVLNK